VMMVQWMCAVTELSETRTHCNALSARLRGRMNRAEITRIYLEMAPLIGRLQAAVSDRERISGETPDIRQAREALVRLKAVARKVGLDIRLGSDAALLMGLRTAAEAAIETLDCLEANPS
jgi:hypothetical protein